MWYIKKRCIFVSTYDKGGGCGWMDCLDKKECGGRDSSMREGEVLLQLLPHRPVLEKLVTNEHLRVDVALQFEIQGSIPHHPE